MVHAAPQLTPPQLLEAGRRAEAEGKLDLATQFYRHLAEHYAYTGEAAEARNGIGRIGAVQAQVWHANGHAHMHDAGRAVEARPRAQRGARLLRADSSRTGRALAVVISAFGWLTVLLGAAVPFAAALLPGVGMPFLELPQLIAGAVGLGALGLFVVFCGQAARALFDQANATRELVALERAKIGND